MFRSAREALRQAQERERWYQRRIEDLENRLMHMSGQTWMPPPADLSVQQDHVEDLPYLPDLEPIEDY